MLTVSEAMIPARKYLDEQISIMRKFGAVKDLSPEAYEAIVVKIAKITVKARGGKITRC